MTNFGLFVRWPNPRAYDLIAEYRWGDFQRSLLLGQRSWEPSGMSRGEAKALAIVLECLGERGYRIDRAMEADRVVARVTIDGLPLDDVMLPTLLEQWGLRFRHIRILSLEGPVEIIGRVPIFRGSVFGNIEGINGRAAHGFSRDAFFVGCVGVGAVVRSLTDGSIRRDLYCPMRYERSRIRDTLRKARNTAARVERLMDDWEEYLAWTARQTHNAEQARLEAERDAEEVEDEGVLGFVP